MRHFALPTIFIATLATLTLFAQDPPAPANESRGLPPRASPSDYQAHGDAGSVTIAAEFKGHAIPTAKLLLNSEDYICVELALYGPAGTRTKLSIDDFSLRVNGAKKPLPSQSDVLVFHSVRDPEWEPEVKVEKGSKTSIGGGGKGGQEAGAPPPLPPKPPIELQRSWSKTVQQSVLTEGDRTLPQAGLIFFKYGGKTKGIRSLELIYEGPAGKATVALEP
jgi:hypothetical protein